MHEPHKMETLPTEVFNEILDQFEPGLHDLPRANPWARPRPYKPEHIDSKQYFARLRLVSKRFSELAAPYLFRSIGLRFNLKSFGRLERLSDQPKLAKHVKKFVYLMPYLYVEGTQDFETFRADRAIRLPNKLRQIMFEDREPFYYPTVYKEQQDVMRGSYDQFVLRKAMKSFTSLQQIQLLSVMVHKDIVLRNLASSIDNWEFIDCRWIPACSHAVETLLLAILYGKPPVNSFSSPTLSPQSLLAIGSGMQQSALASFKQLSHLDVTFDERPDRSYLDTATTQLRGHISPISEFFRQFCMCTVNLTTLYLRFTPGLPVRLPLEDVFHNTVWSKLRILGIGSWMLKAEEVIGIAKRHQGTLKGIRLSEVYLADGDRWRDVAIALNTHMKKLDWVSFQDIGYESEYVRKVAYVETYSDTSSEEDEDDSLEMDAESISSSSSHVHPSQAGDDVIYGNVFTSSEDAGISSDTSSLDGGANAGVGGLGEREECEPDEDLEDYGLTVTQAQRKHWERWIVGKNVNTGEPYTRPL
ncbi:unnamed protein product [Tuber aestivum]|uniref:F-box domain-containing protein n=1 Tax=Tuber aestivum TaxID=59557 RepID=A0A292PP40_9PEZI|nr:unnamed protein product [Tuber aestivum]